MILIKNTKTPIPAFLIIFKYLYEFSHTLSYINDFIRYETSFSVLNALRRGDLLTIKDMKNVLHQYVEEGSMSDGSINRFFNIKNTKEIGKKIPGITLRLNHDLLDTLIIPTEPFMLEKYVDYYHNMTDRKSEEREINNRDLMRKKREEERESEERMRPLLEKMKKKFPGKFPD